MKFSTKEIIDKLMAYLVQQDINELTRALANHMLDAYRIYSLKNLPDDERKCLFERIDANAKTLVDFMTNGPDGDFKCKPWHDDHD